MAASPGSLEVQENSQCDCEMVYRKRGEDVTVCTLTGLSGQDEFHELLGSVLTMIGENDRQTLPKRCSDKLRHFRRHSLHIERKKHEICDRLGGEPRTCRRR